MKFAAKKIATPDTLANGRDTLRVRACGLREEFDAIGVPFGQRGKRLDENVEAINR